MKDSGVEWLGRIPSGWGLSRAKTIFRLTKGRGNKRKLTLLAATQKHGMYPQELLESVVRVKEGTDLSTFRTVQKDDFVISLRSFQGGFEHSDYEGVCSPAYQTFRAYRAIVSQYFKYLFKSAAFIHHLNSLTVGIRDGKSINYSDFASSAIPVPPLEEQRRIANYLDAKCAEIDRAIKAAEDSIEEYKDYREALISRVIRTGLRGKEQLTECDCKIIRNIPVGWGLVRINRIATLHNGDRGREYPSGIDIVPDGVPFITSAELGDNRIARRCAKHITRRKYDCLKGVKLRKGDVVFCLRGSVGKCSLNDFYDEGTIASSLTVARTRDCFPSGFAMRWDQSPSFIKLS